MQYYIHSHGFGSANRKCLKILLKGLRQIELPLDIHETALPSPFTARPDNTRVSTGFGSSARSVPGRFPTQAATARGPIHTAADPNSAYWHTITTGHRVTLSPQIVIQKVGELGHNQRDYFVFANHQMAEVSLASRHVSWSTFTNLPEINYFKYGRYTMPGADGDGIDNMEQLKRAVLASREFMPAEIGSRFEELVTPQALAVMATFGTVYVASQLTPVGWAADALVAVLVVGSCWMLGSELSEVARLFKAFYDTAINAGNNPAKYREAGHYLAQAVSKVGVDVVLGILLHKASVPLQRKLVNMRQSVGVERPVSAVEEPVGKEKAGAGKKKTAVEPSRLAPELEKYAAQGLDRAKLQAAYEAAPDKAAFLADLDKAPTIYAKQELIRDFDKIPGVKAEPYEANGLPEKKVPYIDENGSKNPELDLSANDAQNFSKAKATYLKPGTKLYRVVGGKARDTGGYWVTADNLPKGYGDVIGGTAVDPEWGNSYSEIIEYTVPEEGMVVWEGPAASQPVGKPRSSNHNLPGGDDQIFIPEKYRDYKNKEVFDKFNDNITKRIPIEWKR